jgi:thioredoxin-related protein
MRQGLVAMVLGLAVAAMAATAASAAELIMLERPGCPWCARFNAEIGPIYARTEEGRQAPLRRVNVEAGLPDDLAAVGFDYFTPTFVLVDAGHEIGRIRGYPGDMFFFAQLDRMLASKTRE